MNRAITLFFLLETVFTVAPSAGGHSSATSITATVDPTKTWNIWDGWGSSLAWWARAIGGTRNAGIYADLIYTTSDISVAEEKYRSEEHTSELQSLTNLVCRLLLEKKK